MWTDTDYQNFSGLIAGSNMGLPNPAKYQISKLKEVGRNSRFSWNAEDAVLDLYGGYMESDAMEKIFAEEANYWYSYLRMRTEDFIKETHPFLYELYTSA